VSSQSGLAWELLLTASRIAEDLEQRGERQVFVLDESGALRPSDSDDPDAVLEWVANAGWQSRLSPEDPISSLVDLYLPLCGATSARPITVGHLGQSLDGFIATQSGDSKFVTGNENLVHMHRMRALCDAVLVGAGTVAADDPQLTTRHVRGSNPLRVVFDPTRRLTSTYSVFTDNEAPTLYVCEGSRIADGETHVGHALMVGVDAAAREGDVEQVLALLRARHCARVFVEGGGITVSAFLEANLLDRLQLAVAPVLIGDGRRAIRLPASASLRDCRRPRYRVFQMGGDVLFDCELNPPLQSGEQAVPPREIVRVI
jgi:diaminohydroxyphosphoribosylaminopyrimidine deaminase / 5-amino-6-(5-phosphoribosylamino)uracil reductase